MGIEVSFNTDQITAKDREILALILGEKAVASTEKPSAAKPAPKKKVEKAAPEPEPEDDDEDLVGGDEDKAPTMEDVVARATAVVQAGHAKKVKETLVDLGVAKVSQLKAGQFEEFLKELADIDVD